MEIKKYDKVPLNQNQKLSSTENNSKASNPSQPVIAPKKEEAVLVPLTQKSKSTVSIKNKKANPCEKSFTKEETPPLPPQSKIFFIRTKDNVDLKVNLDIVYHFTMLELKKYSFPIFFDENKNIRLIFRGKLLQDNEIVSKSNNCY